MNNNKYGGLGFSQTTYGRACMLIASHCMNVFAHVSVHQSVGVSQPLMLFGTPEQKRTYLPRVAGGELSAFALTEPLPYVGVETGVLSGKVRVAEWKEGQEPILQVDKRGRFITNMGFANIVTAAVDTADSRK